MTDQAPPDGRTNIDQIHILLPNQTVRSEGVKRSGMLIGREASCDLVLDHPSISRQHARIEFDGADYRVTDLNSKNGTYLGNVRLLSGTATTWTPDENLRVGEIWMRLERAEQELETVAVHVEDHLPTAPTPVSKSWVKFSRPDGGLIDPNQVTFSQGEGRIGLFSEIQNLSVSPGSPIQVKILAFNCAKSQDTFRASVHGIPPSWLAGQPQPAIIAGGGRSEFHFTIKPPRKPQSKAGRHPVMVRVASQADSSQVAELRLILTVTAFSHFASELRPEHIKAGEIAKVTIQNQGNLPEKFTVYLEDKLDELSFSPVEGKATIQPGQSASLEFRASPSRLRLMGSEMSHNFQALVSSQGGQLQSHSGQVTSKAVVPSWGPVALGIMGVLILCLICGLYYLLSAPDRAIQRTAQANRTSIALIVLQTGMASTQTAEATGSASKGTASAATATAIWLALDSDMDGLTNQQELQLKTRPDKVDTDGDGLTDGEEVKTWLTNPLLPDTDGDSLSDSDEVKRGLNPLKKDTDGDGLEDNVDPDPGKASSPTPSPSLTFTLTPSPTILTTPTRTSTPTATNTPISTADLQVSVSDNQSTSTPGTSFAYTIIVTNKGPASINGARITDNFPSSFNNVTWTCTASVGSRCSTASGSGNIAIEVDLAIFGTATLVANGTLSATATGILSNTANVAPPPGMTDPNTGDNSATDTDILEPKVSFTFTKTDGQTSILPGQNTSYTIVATNAGPSAVSGVTIIDTLPDALTNVTWICAASTGSSCSTAGVQNGNVNVSVTLLPGGNATITISAKVKNNATGTITNTANLSSPIDPGTNNKTATDTTAVVPQADLSVEVDAPFSVGTSSTLTITITVNNLGPAAATNVVLTEQLPAGATFVSSSPGAPTCSLSGLTLTCNLGSLAAGASVQIKIVVTTPPSIGIISFQTDVNASEDDPNTGNNGDVTDVLIL